MQHKHLQTHICIQRGWNIYETITQFCLIKAYDLSFVKIRFLFKISLKGVQKWTTSDWVVFRKRHIKNVLEFYSEMLKYVFCMHNAVATKLQIAKH